MTFHLHIKGRVQGVGFRPYVYRSALNRNLPGYVSNGADGVHVIFNHTCRTNAETFAEEIIQQAPSHSIIQSYSLRETAEQKFDKFFICIRGDHAEPDLLISPDFAMCEQCRAEFHDNTSRRYQYPFITCTICGPRYSLMSRLPYERHLTTMSHFHQCPECLNEYADLNDRRYFSQTNSCARCGPQLSWHSKQDEHVANENKTILAAILRAFARGEIVAVKGIGGFLLMCDASNRNAIGRLRERKHRPRKPFAVLFPDAEYVRTCTYANAAALKMLQGETAPIVLLQAKPKCFEELDMHAIAPGLSTIGVMLPYAPLLEWIISKWQRPLVATSGNLNGSCIVFQSEKKNELFRFADHILDHEREIVIPQDDSVVRFAGIDEQQIMLRRSRGFAPAIILPSLTKTDESIFAAGAMLKSAFAIQHNNQIYLSQFLGNLESYDTQQNYRHTFDHLQQLLKTRPQIILADVHPDYPSTGFAEEYAERASVPVKKVQHHEAHFAAILGEHNLFANAGKILGVIWDGTGLGSDGNTWGGEFFIYQNGTMRRAYHLESFPNIAGDKMANEPRLAASAIFNGIEGADAILSSKFSKQESEYYGKAIAHEHLKNTSAGRYFDAVASVLGLVDINSYEGEAALILEQSAYNYFRNHQSVKAHYFSDEIIDPSISMKNVMRRIIEDILAGKNTAEISAAFHNTLAMIIYEVAMRENVKRVAFSGGVFQNALLVDLVNLQLANNFELYFHKQMPPNDECIAFGQVQHYLNITNKN